MSGATTKQAPDPLFGNLRLCMAAGVLTITNGTTFARHLLWIVALGLGTVHSLAPDVAPLLCGEFLSVFRLLVGFRSELGVGVFQVPGSMGGGLVCVQAAPLKVS